MKLLDRRAEMGVGTLIIFIAMLLVAAVAAAVLIQTAGSLQEKALSTGNQAKSQISTNAITIEVSATDGSGGMLLNFTQTMKLAPGSNPIKLGEVTMTFNTINTTTTLTYDSTVSDPQQDFATNATAENGTFTVEYLQTGSNWVDGNLQRGDIIRIYFAAPRNISEDEQLRINFIPKIGTPTLTQFVTPDVISTERVYLYP